MPLSAICMARYLASRAYGGPRIMRGPARDYVRASAQLCVRKCAQARTCVRASAHLCVRASALACALKRTCMCAQAHVCVRSSAHCVRASALKRALKRALVCAQAYSSARLSARLCARIRVYALARRARRAFSRGRALECVQARARAESAVWLRSAQKKYYVVAHLKNTSRC